MLTNEQLAAAKQAAERAFKTPGERDQFVKVYAETVRLATAR